MVEKFFQLAREQGVEVPELVDLDQIGIIAGEDEVGVVFEKQIGDVVQMHEAIQFRRTQAGFLAQFVAKQPGGFVQVVDEMGVFGRALRSRDGQ